MTRVAIDPELAERRRRGVPTTPEGVRDLRALAMDLGADELVLRPCAAGLDQLERLAALVG